MKIDSAVELKRMHAKKIIHILKMQNNMTKRKIMGDINLSFATVSNICNELREKGYLEEQPVDDTKAVGRTPKNILLKSENLLVLCYDLTKYGIIRVAVIDYLSKILYKEEYLYSKEYEITDLVEECTAIYEKHVLQRFQIEQIIGIGVAIPGIFEKRTHHIVSSEIDMFNNQPLKAMFEKKLHKTIYIDNDSNLCVMSKYVLSRHSNDMDQDVIYIFADEGLGIGVISNGMLIRGSGGYAPEICHMPIGNMQLTCHLCSNRGCVESDLRSMGFVEKFNLYDKEKIQSFQQFIELSKEGNYITQNVIAENAEIWGKLLSVLNNIFNPGHIYLGGETISLMKTRFPQIMEQMKSKLLAKNNALPRIEEDINSSDTLLHGAAEMIFSQWVPEL